MKRKPKTFTDHNGRQWEVAVLKKDYARCISQGSVMTFERTYVEECLKDESPSKDFGA